MACVRYMWIVTLTSVYFSSLCVLSTKYPISNKVISCTLVVSGHSHMEANFMHAHILGICKYNMNGLF